MFMRTDRLFLRPAWVEDAPAILTGIAEPDIVRNLALLRGPTGLKMPLRSCRCRRMGRFRTSSSISRIQVW